MECQSGCCVVNSLNPQKFCTAKTVFLHCVPWQKPAGYLCWDHSECQSDCCVTNSISASRFCKLRTIFYQCIEWRKPIGALCDDHSECQTKCCLSLNEINPPRCVPRTGILARCLPLVSPRGQVMRLVDRGLCLQGLVGVPFQLEVAICHLESGLGVHILKREVRTYIGGIMGFTDVSRTQWKQVPTCLVKGIRGWWGGPWDQATPGNR
ncbi:PREDICTED: leucine-rich colipase-like protein 1 isoform X1 [Hipposideros armiger]|uniref:Leucine-rich colipase-like protein 1 isoform X1 n=2 Tax=Hipposideros armiger TaxID=186990 RepID=A0A8B7QIK7_HIPAR|nr:PREDICTED: leucine-rich colipase-like protein 1 isoform X1 [Hipposideros armiger]